MNGITEFFNRLFRGVLRLILVAAIAVFLLSLLMTLPPAMRAYRTQPAEALRYE